MKKFFIAVFFVSVGFIFGINVYAEEFSIVGKITSLNEGVKGIEVNIDDQLYETDENGYYRAEHMSAGGKHIIKIERLDFCSSPEFIKIDSLDKNIKDADFVVYGEIVGQVTYNEMPLKNAIVKINDREQKYFTDAKGNYRILNVGLNKEYVVSVSSKCFTIPSKKIVLRSVEPVVDTELETAVSDSAKKMDKQPVVEASSETEESTNILNFKAEISKYNITINAVQGIMPLENVEITVNNDTKNKYKTNKDGVCEIKGLLCNRKYIIKAKKKDIQFVKRIYTIDNITEDTKIDLEAYVDVSGKVSIDNGPFANVVVECGDRKAQTDKNGNYIFKNVEPNKPYKIKAVSSIFTFDPAEIPVKSLRNSLAENNFAVTLKEEDRQDLPAKISAQKKESAKIMKEYSKLQKTKSSEKKKVCAEEDLKVKEEVLAEQERIKEKQLQEEQELAAYKAALEEESVKETIKETEAKLAPVKEQKQSVTKDKEEVVAEEKEEQATISIQGRVMKNKEGVSDVQIMLICPPSTKKFRTDRNGFYKISDLEKNKNYVVTVLTDIKTAKLSPKSRMYKELNTDMKNQNFYYIVDRDTENKDAAEQKK